MGFTCGICKPRYKRHVDDVYPRDPRDEKLIRTGLKYFQKSFYAFQRFDHFLGQTSLNQPK